MVNILYSNQFCISFSSPPLSPYLSLSTAGSDYTPINRRELTFINESSQSIVVFIHNDTFLESSETFGVRLTAVQSQVIITQPTVIVTIENDDSKNRVRGGRESFPKFNKNLVIH